MGHETRMTVLPTRDNLLKQRPQTVQAGAIFLFAASSLLNTIFQLGIPYTFRRQKRVLFKFSR